MQSKTSFIVGLSIPFLVVIVLIFYYAIPVYKDAMLRDRIAVAYDCDNDPDSAEESDACESLFILAKHNCFRGNIFNCSDFAGHQEAQSLYKLCKVVAGNDVHKLDGDFDGIACEE
jgi:hypothetical protein